GADAAVSIHMNKFSDRRVRGPMAYYQAGAAEGEKLAAAVIDSLTEALSLKPRHANPGNNFVTRIPVCPAVLVECGFLSHPEEERLLQDDAYQRTLAEAVARGVIASLEGADTGR
ncbi:MAG: N-acetylmuramoyl-L-alanine amidase, partial [Clostridia bacterium]|nr:N-acetylmuramoyl-L-alanine amidase [Clostridia bacterium]